MINIGILESQTLLRESFKLTLDTDASYNVVFSSDDYKNIYKIKEHVGILLLDISHFKQYRDDAPHNSFLQEAKIVVVAEQGEEDLVIEALEAQARGFLFKEMESQEFLHALQQISRGKIYIHGQASHYLVTYYQEQLEARQQQDEIETGTNPLPKQMFRTLELASQGLSNQEIADQMGLSDKTVKNQMSNILTILQVQNRTAAIVKAVQQGWITIPKNT